MSRESGAGPERGGTHSGGMNKGGANSGSSKGSRGSSKGSGRNDSTNRNTSTRASGGKSKEGWGGGASLNLGGGSYKASTAFGRGDTGSSFGNFSGSGKSYGGSNRADTGKHDAAFQNFRVDTPANTQLMNGKLYSRNTAGNWADQTGREIGNTQLDRLAYTDTLRQTHMLQRGYDDLTMMKNFFTGLNPFADDPEEAAAGYSPMGGWASYGGAIPGMKNPQGFFDRLATSFEKFGWALQDAPLKAISDVLSNPMISTIGLMTGTAPIMAAVRAASAVSDMATGVTDTLTGAKELAGIAITGTPAGKALGPLRGIAGGLLKSPEEGARATGALVGGKVGSNVGAALSGALTDNPYAGAIASALGGTLGATGFGNLAAGQVGMEAPKSTSKPSERTAGADVSKSMSSPLLASRETSQKLMEQGADPTKYIREMQLPFYGPQYTMNPYGFPNTMIGMAYGA